MTKLYLHVYYIAEFTVKALSFTSDTLFHNFSISQRRYEQMHVVVAQRVPWWRQLMLPKVLFGLGSGLTFGFAFGFLPNRGCPVGGLICGSIYGVAFGLCFGSLSESASGLVFGLISGAVFGLVSAQVYGIAPGLMSGAIYGFVAGAAKKKFYREEEG